MIDTFKKAGAGEVIAGVGDEAYFRNNHGDYTPC
jgi:hypothetical protein